jgi:hypothetical protein
MDSTTAISTLVGAIGALAPALLLISSHYKKLRDEVIMAKAEFTTGVTMLKQEFHSGFQLVNQKIASLERQISDQQKHLTKIHDDHVRLAERMAVVETRLGTIEGDVVSIENKMANG